jgi:hypothetical protein
VIKRLADAKTDNDRIYAVIEGVSGGSGSRLTAETLQTEHRVEALDFQDRHSKNAVSAPDPVSGAISDPALDPALDSASDLSVDPASDLLSGPGSAACQSALDRLLAGAGIHFSDLSFVDTHSGGAGPLASMEIKSLARFNPGDPDRPCALGWTAGTIGDTRGASGLCSVIQTALCLHHGTIPGIRAGIRSEPWMDLLKKNGFVTPQTAMSWPKSTNSPRRAVTTAMTHEGGTSFCLLAQAPDTDPIPPDISGGRSRAAGRSKNTVTHDPQAGLSDGVPPSAGHPAMVKIPTTRPAIDPDLMAAMNRSQASPTAGTATAHAPPADNPPADNPPARTAPASASDTPLSAPNDPVFFRTAANNPLPGRPATEVSRPDPIPEPLDTAAELSPPGFFADPEPTLAASFATAQAHEKFLAFTRTRMDQMQTQFEALARAAAAVIQHPPRTCRVMGTLTGAMT